MLKTAYKSASGKVYFSCSGLSLERMMNQCAQEGVRIQAIRRAGPKTIAGIVSAADFSKLEEIARMKGWKIEKTGEKGAVEMRRFFFKRAALFLGVLVFAFLGILSLNCIWNVEIQNAGAYQGEVRRILKENDVVPGRFFWTIGKDGLQETIGGQLPGLSWVGVRRLGVTLRIECVQAEPGENAPKTPGSLYAKKSGVVESVRVFSGTAAVQAGDAVYAGQMLIQGEERALNGEKTHVRARGSVQARVWLEENACVSLQEISAVPTGNMHLQNFLCIGKWEIPLGEKPAFDEYDTEVSFARLGGLFPVWLRRERHFETKKSISLRPAEQAIAEAKDAAMLLALEKAPKDTQILDKWADYSMIKDGYVYARAVVETLQEIADISN